jgi:hypothetical protein
VCGIWGFQGLMYSTVVCEIITDFFGRGIGCGHGKDEGCHDGLLVNSYV